MHDIEAAIRVVDRLRAAGMQVSIHAYPQSVTVGILSNVAVLSTANADTVAGAIHAAMLNLKTAVQA